MPFSRLLHISASSSKEMMWGNIYVDEDFFGFWTRRQ
jgi:hypothetical protein